MITLKKKQVKRFTYCLGGLIHANNDPRRCNGGWLFHYGGLIGSERKD